MKPCFQSLIDPAPFGQIADYLKSPQSPINYLLHVKDESMLSAVAEKLDPMVHSLPVDCKRIATVLNDLFRDLPIAGGIHVTCSQADDVFSMCVAPDKSVIPVDRRRNPRDQHLEPWTEEEEAFFCNSRNSDPATQLNFQIGQPEGPDSSNAPASEPNPKDSSMLPPIGKPKSAKKLPDSFRKFFPDVENPENSSTK